MKRKMSDTPQFLDEAMKTLQAPQSQFGILKLNFFMTALGIMFILSVTAAVMYQTSQDPTKRTGQTLFLPWMTNAFEVSRQLLTVVFIFVIVLPALYRASLNITNAANVWTIIKPLIYSFGLASLIPLLYNRYTTRYDPPEYSSGTTLANPQTVAFVYCSMSTSSAADCIERPTFTKIKDSVLETLNALSNAISSGFWFNQSEFKVFERSLMSTSTLSAIAVIFGLVQRAALKLN